MRVRITRETEIETNCSDCTKTTADGRLLQTLHLGERVMMRECESCILEPEQREVVEPENILLEPVLKQEPTDVSVPESFIGDDASYVPRRTGRRGSHTPATERYDLSEIYGNNMLLRFKLTPTVFELDDNALQEKVDIITSRWQGIGDRDLCELLFSDFDCKIQSDSDRERYYKVQEMRRRGSVYDDARYGNERDNNGITDVEIDAIRRNQHEFSNH